MFGVIRKLKPDKIILCETRVAMCINSRAWETTEISGDECHIAKIKAFAEEEFLSSATDRQTVKQELSDGAIDIPVQGPKCELQDREKIPGETEIVTYPEDGGIYPNNQLITYLGLRQDRAVVKNSEGEWKVKVTYQDMQPSAYCMFGDSLRFYSAGFNFLCAVDEQDEFIWRFCEQNSTKTHVLPKRSPKYGNTYPDNIAILAVFQSNGYQGGKGFVFEW